MIKACVIQPPYSTDYALSDEYFRWETEALDRCDESMDLIVMPESADMPCLASSAKERAQCLQKYNRTLLKKASETAKRCGAVLFVNATSIEEKGQRNTTYAFDRKGQQVGKYFKQHPTNGEVEIPEGDSSYSFEYEPVTVIEIDGLRYGFLTCYDFYFYEAFARMARQNLDIIIGCSHQRTDTHDALETMCKFCAYNTNTYLVRASVSMGENSEIGGVSCIVAPTGEILANMKSRTGMITAEFDRPAGSAIVLPDERMPYPRVCAHRGFNTIAPENSLPAYGAAIALGAQEIEFDLWPTTDGEIVSTHDDCLERVSTGTGLVYEHSYAELLKYDFGAPFGEAFQGMKILTFEEILKKFACHVIMNIHIKELAPYDEALLKKIISLIREYDCEKYVYFMTSDEIHRQLRISGGAAAP